MMLWGAAAGVTAIWMVQPFDWQVSPRPVAASLSQRCLPERRRKLAIRGASVEPTCCPPVHQHLLIGALRCLCHALLQDQEAVR